MMGVSPAAAIAWEFRRRHRWGFLAVGGYLVVIAAIHLAMVRTGQRFTDDDPERFAFLVLVPMTAAFTYVLAVFTFGLNADLAARQSMYPARMFTLPLTTAALAGWPMVYGSVVMTLLWLATRALAAWPADVEVPVLWPALLAASLLAWAQALTWMPYGLRGLRLIVTMLWLVAIDTVVLVALHFNVREPLMLAFLAPHVPLAYLVARGAVARARRGDVPDWRGAVPRLRWTRRATTRLDGFSSAARAQAWLEWRRHGWTLPTWVALLLPIELALLWIAGDTPALVFAILIGVLLTPPVMAAFGAVTVRKVSPEGTQGVGVPPFLATRPLTSAALIAAKLRMTAWSTLAAWVAVLVAIPVALVASGTWPVVVARARESSDTIGTTRTVVVVVLVLAGLIVSTWKQLVQSLWVGLTGREWIVRASLVLALAILCALGPTLVWIAENRRVLAALWDALPMILALLVGCKMILAAWVAVRLDRAGALPDRVLIACAAGWLVAVLALYALLVWFFSTPFVPRYVLALLAILAIPLTRVSAAPLALAWSRHR